MAGEPWNDLPILERQRGSQGAPWDELTAPDHSTRVRSPRAVTAQEYRERYRYPQRVAAQARSHARGIPILGNFIDRTQATRDYESAHPYRSGTGQFLAGGLAFGPASFATHRAAAGAGNVIRSLWGGDSMRRSPGLIGDMTSQGLLGAGAGLADRQTSEVPIRDAQELATVAGIHGGTGAFGPLAGRVIGPSGVGRLDSVRDQHGRMVLRPTPENMRMMQRLSDRLGPEEYGTARTLPELERMIHGERGRMLAEGTEGSIARFVVPAAAAGIGHRMSGDMSGALFGYAGAEAGRQLLSRGANTGPGRWWLGRQMTPENAAVMRAMLLQSPSLLETIDNPTTLTGR